MNEFKLYNNCLVSNVLPHNEPDISKISELILKNHAMLARWTTNFDCDEETQWWYVIKDDTYNCDNLKSKDRYEINKGKKNFDTIIIEPKDYLEELYSVYVKANLNYSVLSRNDIDKKTFVDFFEKRNMNNKICIASFGKVDKVLSAYAILELKCNKNDEVIDLQIVKSLPEKKGLNVNAALLDYICSEFLNKRKVKYICDGERSIRHITNFQNYLIKYFGFRRAYCDLNIKYSKKMNIVVNFLYPFRNIIKKFSQINRKLYNVYCILYQEEIHRSFK